MKYYLTILTFAAILFTGCLDANDPGCVPVDQSSYLAEYAEKEGYITTDSGLIYRVIKEGDVEVPSDIRFVFVTFEGRLVNDEVFERTDDLIFIDKSSEILLSGIKEGLSMMKEGATYELVMPPELAFGNEPPANSIIQCGAVVIYEITLDSFLRDVETFLENNADFDDVEVTESGLQYRVIEEGEGDHAEQNSSVRVIYEGKLTNDYVFDRSPGNSPVRFNVSEVIPGFAEGLQLMNEGSKYQFFIPPNLGYGNNPPRNQNGILVLPPNAILVFDVEMVEIL